MTDQRAATHPSQAAQIAYWNDDTAVHWAGLQHRIETVFAPLSAIGLQAAAPCPGERALDIGCGCGDTVLALAGAVGVTGHVFGVDVSIPMTAIARQRMFELGIRNAEVVNADAETYVFAPKDRDLLFSRFGAMFFSDPVAATANLWRATRVGGRLCWVVYRELNANPWFTVPLLAASPLLPDAADAAAAATRTFSLADPNRVRHILAAGGWRDVNLTRHDVTLNLGSLDNADAAADLVSWMGPLARRLQDAVARAAVLPAVAAALREHAREDVIALTASVWVIGATA